MGTRQTPGRFDCAAKAEDTEPVFTLLGRDSCAPWTVEFWAYRRLGLIWLGLKPSTDRAMVDEALDCAMQMRAWREEHRGKGIEPAADGDYNAASERILSTLQGAPAESP